MERAGSDVLDRLHENRERWREADERVTEHGEETLTALRDALDRAERLLARYEESATGTGDFEAFVEFQGTFAELVEELPDDLPGREAFEQADDRLQKRRLSRDDFAAARETLAEPRELADRLDERDAARNALQDARRAVQERIEQIDEEIDELERVRRFADADVDAPTDRLRDPIERYDERARETFDAFRRHVPAREALAVIDETRHFPLVPFERPPSELLAYLRETDAGRESITTLTTYDDYSRSKLAHYVDDPGRFQTRVAVHRTYLDRLSADPMTIGWPPPPAGELRRTADELVSVVARIARRVATHAEDPTTTADPVAAARRLYRLSKWDDYDRLQRAAVADAELSGEQRDRLQSGELQAELDSLRSERERLAGALADRVA